MTDYGIVILSMISRCAIRRSMAVARRCYNLQKPKSLVRTQYAPILDASQYTSAYLRVGMHRCRRRNDHSRRGGSVRWAHGRGEHAVAWQVQVVLPICAVVYYTVAWLTLLTRWFTSMLGKMSSLTDIVQSLRARKVSRKKLL